MKRLLALTLGALLLIVAVAGFVIVPANKPVPVSAAGWGNYFTDTSSIPGRWSKAVYDIALIGTWAALIVGALLVTLGVIAYARHPERPPV